MNARLDGTMDILTTLLAVYLGLIVTNVAYAALNYFFHRDTMYLLSLLIWIGTLVNVAAQGVFQEPSLGMVLSYSTDLAVTILLAKVLGTHCGFEIPARRYLGLMALVLAAVSWASRYQIPFWAMALPVSIVIALPLFDGARRALKVPKKSWREDGPRRTYIFLLIVEGIHYLDYPFIRNDPRLAVAGFSFALALLMAFSICLPSFVIQDISQRHLKRVDELNGWLAQSQKDLSEMTQLAKFGEMSFGFVHDMASPISILSLYASQLSTLQSQHGLATEKVSSFAKGIGAATERLFRMQQLFRNFVQRDGKKELVEVDLSVTLQDCVDLYKPALRQVGAEILVDSFASQSTVRTWAGTVDRVLLNLIQNAINAIALQPKKEIHIRLTDEPSQIHIEISDTGGGLPKERLNSLWQRFGHSTTGSGFGLYKIHEMIVEAGGTITVKNTGPGGTTFLVTLPRAAPALDQVTDRFAEYA